MEAPQWELSKENMQPLKAGRRLPAALVALSSDGAAPPPPPSPSQRRAEFESLILKATSANDHAALLTVWAKCVPALAREAAEAAAETAAEAARQPQPCAPRTSPILHPPSPPRSYIDWVKAEWPAGGADAGLVPLLERATATFVNVPAMADNVECVKLWITYVRVCRRGGGKWGGCMEPRSQ